MKLPCSSPVSGSRLSAAQRLLTMASLVEPARERWGRSDSETKLRRETMRKIESCEKVDSKFFLDGMSQPGGMKATWSLPTMPPPSGTPEAPGPAGLPARLPSGRRAGESSTSPSLGSLRASPPGFVASLTPGPTSSL